MSPVVEPSPEILAEYSRRLATLRQAISEGQDTEALEADLTQFMVTHGLGEEGDGELDGEVGDFDEPTPARPPVGDTVDPDGIIATAILQARAEGDEQTAAELEAILQHPDLAARTIEALQDEVKTAPVDAHA